MASSHRINWPSKIPAILTSERSAKDKEPKLVEIAPFTHDVVGTLKESSRGLGTLAYASAKLEEVTISKVSPANWPVTSKLLALISPSKAFKRASSLGRLSLSVRSVDAKVKLACKVGTSIRAVILEVFVKISPILTPPIEVARFNIEGSIAPVISSSNNTLPAKIPAVLVDALPKPKLV